MFSGRFLQLPKHRNPRLGSRGIQGNRKNGPDGLLCDRPILKPAQWTLDVNGVETEAELAHWGILEFMLRKTEFFGIIRLSTEGNMSTIDIAEPIQERFDALREDWKSRTSHLSNVAQIALVSSYQQIIGMGPQALPLILTELQQQTDHWFWALEAITGENPVPKVDAGNMAASAAAWIAWGKSNGYLK